MLRTLRTRRPAFTLVEMLVVMGIIIALAGVAVAVAESGAFGSQKVISAADRASGWLLIAKQRAVRDQTANGVRFFRHPQAAADPNTYAYRFTEAQYIEQPNPWAPNPAQEANPTGPRIVFSYQWTTSTTPPQFVVKEVYLVSFDPQNPAVNTARAADLAEFDSRVSAGDYLRLPDLGANIRVIDTGSPPGPQPGPTAQLFLNVPNPTVGQPPVDVQVPPTNFRRLIVDLQQLQQTLDLSAANSPFTSGNPQRATMTTYKFAFQAQPRPLMGEPILQLTGNTCIDFRDQTERVVLGGQPVTNPYYLPTNLNNPPNTDPRLTSNPQISTTTTFGVDVNTPTSSPAPPGSWEYFDILFTPTGQVQNPQGGLICLWIRDPDKLGPANNLQPHPRFQPPTPTDSPAAFDQAGEQVLVTVYTRSGYIAVHPVTRPGTGPDPYTAAKDGINSGF
ncbi:MAG: hypothetical protein U0871_00225 [Gemmataceae bacterium]